MKLLLSFLVCLHLIAGQPVAQANERITQHQEAIDALAKTHFFMDGGGMILGPDIINAFNVFGRFLGFPDLDQTKSIKAKLSPFATRFGMIEHDNELKGFYQVDYKKMDIGVMGCVVCHSGKAAGVYMVGIGNKNIDIGQIASDAHTAQKMYQKLTFLKPRSEEYKRIQSRAIGFAKRLSDDRYNNLTQGLVPVSMIRTWFYAQVGENLPINEPRGTVKVPHWWGYGKKRFIGQFSDGFGDGHFAGWGLAVELAATQTNEAIHKLMPKIEHGEELIGQILPPAYPFKVDQARATKGKVLFVKNCQGCHGSYERDGAGIPIFQEPKHIAIDKIKTDDDRLKGNTARFFELVDTNPLNMYMKRTSLPAGFFAPRLESVWARFPYLHNGSVPTIYDLLTAPEKRPVAWSLVDAGERHRFDEASMGYTLPRDPQSKEYKSLLEAGKKGERNVYDTRRVGQSSIGHWFKFSDSMSDQDKFDLIEYLKTI